jgi:hypothetical protein
MQNIEKCICVLCQRTVKLIGSVVEDNKKASHNTYANILYVDSLNRCVCGRCVSENTLITRYYGKAIILHFPKKGIYSVNVEALAKAVTTPVSLETEEYYLSTDV